MMAEAQRLPSRIISDRGPAEYFHGRTEILCDFEDLLGRAREGENGTTFLIQGAPGVGKTALLDQCEKRASSQGWEIANIGPGALWDPNHLLASLGRGQKYKGTERSTQIGIKSFLGWGFKSARPQPTVKNILEEGNSPLLLILDEAHGLGEEGIPPSEHKESARTVLEFIHNGKLERPVILLAAGLGTLSAAFGSMGISRFKGGCFIELRALSEESERAVIRDWLKKAGGAKGDLTAWMDTIAQKAHGWPQHILSYVEPAKDYLIANNGIMTEIGLKAVLEAGERGREAYYRQRLKDFAGDKLICFSEVVADIGSGMPFKKELLEAPLIKKYGHEKGSKLFQKFLEKGVIAADGFLYSVPIPSMHDWIKLELKRTQKRLLQNSLTTCKNMLTGTPRAIFSPEEGFLQEAQKILQEMEETQNRSPDIKMIGSAQETPPSVVVPDERSTPKQPTQSVEKDLGIQGPGAESGWER